ncbi:hypothetical protein F994_02774 [Acinetobacter bohemicus ANC 3994]|uniref:Uncharacterized protein n=1 Tax=Acinetobacter bohemicus ANC 3994 TaxID=1217715 RepID=N8Q9R2_9GAMM|nr:hypothetical protein [Acinetobacter bohemicus]ENU18647.1 hypothetical protein F994_02774 [Acinetobacter bohemicus ANC 3994]
MTANTGIKFYMHTNNNAPQLTNNFGCMLNVLDACLVNGIQIGAISSLTAAGTTVTAVFSAAHNLMPYQVVQIEGANQSEYNVETRVLTVPNSTTITFQLASAPTVSPATGFITAKLPALGWEKPFSSTSATGGKGAYRSKNTLLPSRPFLRVVDELDPAYTATYAKYAKVGIVEDMTDIDTMLGVQAPYDSAAPNKNWVGTGSGTTAINGWAKWYYAGATANFYSDSQTVPAGNRNWLLVGNSDYFYILPASIAATTDVIIYGFGAFKSLINVDTSNTFLSCTFNSVVANNTYFHAQLTGLADSQAATKILLQRGYSQAAQSITAKNTSLNTGEAAMYSGSFNYIGAFNLTNVAPFAPVFINETVLRGEMYGLYWLFQNRPYSNYQLIEKNSGLFIAVNVVQSSSTLGQVVLKIGDL